MNWIERLLARLGTPAGASVSADIAAIETLIDDLEGRLTAARAGYLDELDFDLQGLLNAIAGYLTTEIADILTDTGTTIPALLATIQVDLDNPTQYMANLTTLETRLSAVRAGYLDQLDFALQEAIAAIPTTMVGTNNAALATTLEDAMQKATGPAYNQDTDSLEALREILDAIAGYITTEIAEILEDTGTTLPGAIAAIPTTMRGTDSAATVADGWDAALAIILDNFSAARIGYLDQLDFDLQGRLITDGVVVNSRTAAFEKLVGVAQLAVTTIDLNQVAATYDLFIGTTEVVILESLNIKMPTGAAGGALTSISIQTDDVTPGVIINSTDGAVANLTSEADLGWTGALYITVGTKIRLTIAGGAHGTAYVCNVTAKCRAVISGGNLA